MTKPFYTRWWFWVLIGIIALVIIIAVTTGTQQAQKIQPSASPSAAAGSQEPTPETTATPSATAAPGVSASSPATPVASPSAATPATDAPPASAGPSAAPSQASSADQVPLPKQEVLAYSRQLKGSPFIKDVGIGTDNIEINYYGSFAEYKKANPGTKLTTADYTSYFGSGDAINKILMEEPTQLFRHFPGTASIDITLPYSGKTYSVSLTKGSVEKFFNTDLDGIKTDEQWEKQISGPYFNKEYRDQFAKRFVKVN
ncbi:hypothetical protein [Paenibacillus rhizophilus]|uniref:Uncharacterized protein n=1 Tax=Paenibacillus rhizophilus TaxID=1850366 RepID=A0A3N9PDJ0_9BACL|nr:hypothetical protein [Paenibacillus rhizophilus]RQW13675.1 hypothetical protein EH198_04550 [Paenibacillus rhizophilus]